MFEAMDIAGAIQGVINAARRYRDAGPDQYDKTLFALFDALQRLDDIEQDLPESGSGLKPLDLKPDP